MPAITPKKLFKILKKNGFYIDHQVGSHIVLLSKYDKLKRVTLPMHNKDLKPGTLSSILKQAGINKKELIN
jgi:predicted RNA binding protein YcfA (HicA-like mRNA interferase family)